MVLLPTVPEAADKGLMGLGGTMAEPSVLTFSLIHLSHFLPLLKSSNYHSEWINALRFLQCTCCKLGSGCPERRQITVLTFVWPSIIESDFEATEPQPTVPPTQVGNHSKATAHAPFPSHLHFPLKLPLRYKVCPANGQTLAGASRASESA